MCGEPPRHSSRQVGWDENAQAQARAGCEGEDQLGDIALRSADALAQPPGIDGHGHAVQGDARARQRPPQNGSLIFHLAGERCLLGARASRRWRLGAENEDVIGGNVDHPQGDRTTRELREHNLRLGQRGVETTQAVQHGATQVDAMGSRLGDPRVGTR